MASFSSNFDSISPYLSTKLGTSLSIGAATLAVFMAYQTRRNNVDRKTRNAITQSPLVTSIPKLTAQDLATLPYPPDVLPGARDVDTPYGSIRVYEWGPEDGRKVLLVHGISTPCLAIGGVAMKLVEEGCRVMTFDLFGRGYSDNPHLPHNARLYSTQILLVLASSPLPWTGTNAFDLIGYSLGGGIGVAFTASFPHLVRSLVLIAPSGLIREKHIGLASKFLYHTEGIIPESIIHRLVRRRLAAGPLKPPKEPSSSAAANGSATKIISPEQALVAETSGPPPHTSSSTTATQDAYRKAQLAIDNAAPLFPDRPLITVPASVSWQLDAHEGFVAAFVSAIRYAPITGCAWMWEKVGGRLDAQRKGEKETEGLHGGKVLMILGRDDSIIIKEEVEVDAVEAIGGEENIQIVTLEAGHEVPITLSEEVVGVVTGFWGEK